MAHTRSAAGEQFLYNVHFVGQFCTFPWLAGFKPVAISRLLRLRQCDMIDRDRVAYSVLIDRDSLIPFVCDREYTGGLW